MSRSANIIRSFSELSEKAKKKYMNPTPSKNTGNPYHDETGRFVAPDEATVASKWATSSARNKNTSPNRFVVDGWKDQDGEMKPKIKPIKSPAGPRFCGRVGRRLGYNIRCHDGKVMDKATELKLKGAAKSDRAKRG